uniref:Uncharacterized protein n=1 Tax=Cacopsylla melanoneura TaxID=428564 RepID=A0A8D8WTQ5_9HEMI
MNGTTASASPQFSDKSPSLPIRSCSTRTLPKRPESCCGPGNLRDPSRKCFSTSTPRLLLVSRLRTVERNGSQLLGVILRSAKQTLTSNWTNWARDPMLPCSRDIVI